MAKMGKKTLFLKSQFLKDIKKEKTFKKKNIKQEKTLKKKNIEKEKTLKKKKTLNKKKH